MPQGDFPPDAAIVRGNRSQGDTMSENWKKRQSHKELANGLSIGTCIYPPEAPKQSLPEYAADSLPASPVAGGVTYAVSPAVLPFGFSSTQDWQAVLDSALSRKRTGKKRGDGEDAGLEALIQIIVEYGQEMLPLLRLLREKAEGDERLQDIVNILQDQLSLGISAACTLAPREMEVLELAAQGESNAAIAKHLNLQTVTVTKALSRAYRKLDAKNRTDAVHKWMLIRGLPR